MSFHGHNVVSVTGEKQEPKKKLEKGKNGYATSLLMHFFESSRGQIYLFNCFDGLTDSSPISFESILRRLPFTP